VFFFAIPLAMLVGLGIGYLIWGWGGDTSQKTVSNVSQGSAVRYDVSVDDDPYLGPEDAPVTIIMFSDYQCIYCQKWYVEVFKPLLENYPGMIRFVYRDFPLSTIHPSATLSAEAANCAGDQEKYWDFFNAVFTGTEQLSDQSIQNYATAIQLDMVSFFFINGLAVIGAQPYQVFSSLVEQELGN